MPVSRRIYFDANVLLAFVGNEENRADMVQTLLDEARRGELEILTSVLSIAEVAYGAIERDNGLTAEGEASIDELWTPSSPITLVDVSEHLSRRARAIIRDAKARHLSLRSADAIHLASAVTHGCDAIHTYEKQSTRHQWQTLTGIVVDEPTTNTPQLGL